MLIDMLLPILRFTRIRRGFVRAVFCFGFMVCCLFFTGFAGHAQSTPVQKIEGLGKGTALLDGPWQFHVGDDAAWAQPGIDDTAGRDGWEQVTADAPLGTQGHRNFSGYGWYRKHIDLSTAPGTKGDVALYIPTIDDLYEVFWNGQKVAQFGDFPPHLVPYFGVAPQTFNLGPIRSGVLAFRIYKIPLSSVDDGTAGGFESTPSIGSPDGIAHLKANFQYQWLRHSQIRFVLTVLYGLVALLSLTFWFRDKEQKLLLWVGIYSFMPIVELVLNGLQLQVSSIVLQAIIQPSIQFREISQWFLLVYLLQLDNSPRLMRWMRIAAWVTVPAGALDGGLGWFVSNLTPATFGILDAILTFFILPVEAFPIVLILMARFKRKKLDAGRWAVAILAFASATWYSTSNILLQGCRFTHITLGATMSNPIFQFMGNSISVLLILRTLLFLSIVYAVIHWSADYRKKQGTIEQEMKSARELQQVLIPEELPSMPGFAVTSAYRPAQEVGGDFFQIIPLDGKDSGSTMIILGDVSGKGLKAAMTVSLIVGALRTAVRFTSSPAGVLAELNNRLFGRMQYGFATCLAMRVSPHGECVLACAGHPAPYLNQQEIDLPGALPLGISADMTYPEKSIQMKEGDSVALYTDGLLEARGPNGEIFSFSRLDSLMATQPDASQAADAAVNFGQDDDITVLTLTRLASGQRASTRFTAPNPVQA
ncbi:MAG: serine/threonine-protein phosphatase [Acidobacteriota bacterium]|nr:serine/threonine-protein phosphatase [Acidobacteriota bacterium]